MNTNTCYERILGIVCSVFDAYSAVLILPDRSGRAFGVASSFSLGDMLDMNAQFVPGKGLVGWIINNQQPMLVNDFDTRQYHLGYYTKNEESTIKAFMGVSLRNGTGALCLDSKRQYSFSAKDQKILLLFAELLHELQSCSCHMAEQVNLARFYNCLQLIYSLRKRHKNWSVFLEQFLHLVAETSGFEYCSFSVRDEAGNAYFLEAETQALYPDGQEHGTPFGSGLVGYVFNNGKSVFKDGEDAGDKLSPLYGKQANLPQFRSVICLPLTINKLTRGVLTFASESPKSLPEELKVFCQMSAEHLALFLENLYLRSRLYEAGRQIQKLQKTTISPAAVANGYTPMEESD